MTFYPELNGPALDAHRKMIDSLKARAMKELNLGPDEIVVRPLRPADLGDSSSSPDYGFGMTALTWSNIVNNQTIADCRYIGINGIHMFANNASTAATRDGVPPVSQIRITRKGSMSRYWPVHPISHFQHSTGWADDPIMVDQNTSITIEGLARNAASLTDVFDLLGVVVEKRGMLINP